MSKAKSMSLWPEARFDFAPGLYVSESANDNDPFDPPPAASLRSPRPVVADILCCCEHGRHARAEAA
jgi:hypothetical protein